MFKGNTDLRRINAHTYELLSSLTFENDDIKITVKKGYKTDGASIPRAFYTIVGCPLMGLYVGSAIIHDALYDSQLLSKEESDALFLQMLADNGVSKLKQKLMYWAVKYLGNSYWKNVKPEAIEESRNLVSIKRKSKDV